MKQKCCCDQPLPPGNCSYCITDTMPPKVRVTLDGLLNQAGQPYECFQCLRYNAEYIFETNACGGFYTFPYPDPCYRVEAVYVNYGNIGTYPGDPARGIEVRLGDRGSYWVGWQWRFTDGALVNCNQTLSLPAPNISDLPISCNADNCSCLLEPLWF